MLSICRKKTAITGLLMALFLSVPAYAQKGVGKVVFVKGEAMVSRVSEPAPKPLLFGQEVFQMDTLETRDGSLKVLFEDQTILSLAPNSKVLVTEHLYQPGRVRKSIFDILKGRVRTIIEKTAALDRDDVQLRTPTAVAGVRGTDVGIHLVGAITYFLCFDGLIEAYFTGDPAQTVMVSSGNFTKIENAPPSQPVPISQGMMKEFSRQLESDALRDLFGQEGAIGLQPVTPEDLEIEPVPGKGVAEDQEPIVLQGVGEVPPILPGGLDETPPPGTMTGPGQEPTPPGQPPPPNTGPMEVPIDFPTAG